MKKQVFILLFFIFSFHIFAQKIITIDFAHVIDTVKNIQAGNKYYEHTAQLLHQEGIDFIRAHDIHHVLDYSDYSFFWNYDGSNYTINQNFNPENSSDYSWEQADSLIDLLSSNGFDIFFRIGVSYPNPYIQNLPPYDPPCNSNTEPYNFSRFASLTKHIYMHFNENWNNGRNDSIVYWELWNEPGGVFWNGDTLQFYKMYHAVCDTLKTYAPDIKLGAPGAVPSTTIGVNHEYREDFIYYCAQNNLPIDFYSWHIYGAKNPYGIKSLADTIRNILDEKGFTETESIISEINSQLDSSLDTLGTSPYGAAYYLSTLLTAHIAGVEKLFWYPSCVGILSPISGDTMLSRTFYAMSAFHILQENTPLEVENDGNVVVEGNWDHYEDNFMVLSAKSEDNQQFSILISNLSGNITNIRLILNNLPFDNNDSLKVTKSIISNQHTYYTEEETIIGNSNIIIDDPDCPLPGVLFYQIEKIVQTSFSNLNKNDLKINSPAHDYLYLSNLPKTTKKITLLTISGLEAASFSPRKTINISSLPSGVYNLKIFTENGLITKKVVIVR